MCVCVCAHVHMCMCVLISVNAEKENMFTFCLRSIPPVSAAPRWQVLRTVSWKRSLSLVGHGPVRQERGQMWYEDQE